jgi:type I restriction enzyme M protein
MLEQRADCEYYIPRHYRLLDTLRCSPFQLKRLRDITPHIVDGPFGSAIKAEDYAESGIPFIRVADVTHGDGSIKTDDLVFITHEAHKIISRSKAVPGDVIIAKTGATMGAASVLPEGIKEANIRGDLALVGSLRNLLHANYLSTYINTSIGYRLFWRLNSGSTRGRVVISNLRKFPVLWPGDATQRKVVNLIELGRKAKCEKELEAKHLLDSIDDYLLDALGITLPPVPENTIGNRIFRTKRRELVGGRFDPDMAVYSRHTRTSKFELSKLKAHMLTSPQYGANERSVERVSKELPRYVRITDINEFGELSEGLGVAAEVAEDRYLLTPRDLLFARSGNTVGKTYLHIGIDDEPHIFAGYMIRFRLNPATLLPEYAFAYTLCSAYKEWCAAMQRAAGQPNINAEEYKSLLIPVPPIDKQTEIAARVFEIRDQAKQLRQQAEAELETAKRRVEEMLLSRSQE